MYQSIHRTIPTLTILALALVSPGCMRRSQREAAEAAKKKELRAKRVAPTMGIVRVLTLPAGTRFAVTIPAQADLKAATVEGELAAPIAAFTETLVPRGAKVVTAVLPDHATNGELALRATQFRLKNGKVLNVTSDETHLLAPSNPVESLVGFRLKDPLQVTLER